MPAFRVSDPSYVTNFREPTSLPRPAGPGSAFTPPCRSGPAFSPPCRSWARLLPAQQVLGPPSPRPAGSGPAFLPPSAGPGPAFPAHRPAGPGPAVQEASAPPPGPAAQRPAVAWESLFTSLSRSIRVDGAASCLARRKGLPRDRVVFVELFLPVKKLSASNPLGRAVFPFVKEPQDPISRSPSREQPEQGSLGAGGEPQGPSGVCKVLVGLIHSANPYAAPTVCSAAGARPEQ